MTRALLRDNDDPTIMPVPRHWASQRYSPYRNEFALAHLRLAAVAR